MLVKHNLYINPVLRLPDGASDKEVSRWEKNDLIIENLSSRWSTRYLKNESAPDLIIGENYIIGFVGTKHGKIRLYQEANDYKDVISKKDIHYREFEYSGKLNLHFKSSVPGSGMTIKQIFITNQVPDVVIPNQKDFSEDIQAYYPPEGDYKEIEPMRG